MNSVIVENFKEIAELEGIIGNLFKAKAYKNAINILEGLPFDISSTKELKNLAGFGPSLTKKVDEIIRTGKSSYIDELYRNEEIKPIKLLTSIPDVGVKKAKDLIKKNIRNIETLRSELENDKKLLTRSQKLGLKYYDDLKERISYSEIKTFDNILQSIHSEFEVIVAGSFRRNSFLPEDEKYKKTSGDVDVLLFHETVQDKSDISQKNILKEFVKKLKKTDIYVDYINNGNSKFTALIKLPDSPVRHLDIRLFPQNTKSFSILHFTGSANNNKNMRNIAIKKGYSLSEYGLTNLETEELVHCNTEEEIYNYLDMKYLEPHLR